MRHLNKHREKKLQNILKRQKETNRNIASKDDTNMEMYVVFK